MTVYNINLGIGWASSGVEYAQAYRAGILRKLHIPAKFIFTDMFQNENIQHFTKNIGFQDDEVIWLYTFFTDLHISETTYSIETLEGTFSEKVVKKERNGSIIRYYFESNNYYLNVFFKDVDKGIVQRVEYVCDGQLIQKDYFSYTKMFSEYYTPKDGTPSLLSRTFFNEDASIAYEESCTGDNHLFYFPEDICYSKSELVALMMKRLGLTARDLVLLDRATGIGQAVFENCKPAKLGVVVHAEHYNQGSTDDDYVLWNNYYDYQFTNAQYVDSFIVSTEAQKKVLEEQFHHYTSLAPRIDVIPVGSLEEVRYPSEERRAFSVLTASRLATEKHIDWLVKAVVKAHATLPELHFDIYGEGGQRKLLSDLIEENAAQVYIELKGHQDLKTIYAQYQLYLTGSTSEGFGLTLMEAIGSGLPIIGLDVPYGNQTFIDDEQNGYLIPKNFNDDSDYLSDLFAEKLIQYFKTMSINNAIEHSYRKAHGFLEEVLEGKWQQLIKEVLND